MDNVTHALAGGLLAASAVALVERRAPATQGFARLAAVVGVVTAELPDADLLYAGPVMGQGKLGYLLHHRGHTHTVLFAVLAAAAVWAVAAAWRGAARPSDERRALFWLALAGTLSHLALDWTNGYGVHPFWPVDPRWYYGDAVFIVEPWLWVAAIPPLLLAARGRGLRVLLGVLLVGILAAAWRVGQVGRGAALALTVGAAAWALLVTFVPPRRRIAAALAAWLVVEATFFAAAGAARRRVREAVGPALLDAALTPAVADPLCFRALVVEVDAEYRVTAAAVAPFPALRAVAACADGLTSARSATEAVRWGEAWRAPAGELAALARTRCDVAAALRFMRVPFWRRASDGALALFDLRYGDGGGGFADLDLPPRPAACPRGVPGWAPPRQDLLGAR